MVCALGKEEQIEVIVQIYHTLSFFNVMLMYVILDLLNKFTVLLIGVSIREKYSRISQLTSVVIITVWYIYLQQKLDRL